jgi:hypothetical protein
MGQALNIAPAVNVARLMPRTNQQLAAEAIELARMKSIPLKRAAANVASGGHNALSVLRTAQRMMAKMPRTDEAVEHVYAEAAGNTKAARAAVGIIDSIPARPSKPTWERVEWFTVLAAAGPVEARVERRAVEIVDRTRGAPLISYEWRVVEERPQVKRPWKTDAFPSKEAACAAFKSWAERRGVRRSRLARSPG